MLRAEPTRVGVAHDLSAQGSGLSARQTKGSPYAPGITPTPAVDLRVGIHFLEGVTQVVSLVNPAIFVKLLLSPMRKLEVSVLMAQGSNSPLPREPWRERLHSPPSTPRVFPPGPCDCLRPQCLTATRLCDRT